MYFFLSFSHVTLIPINGVCDKKLNTERTGVKSGTQTELTNTKKNESVWKNNCPILFAPFHSCIN